MVLPIYNFFYTPNFNLYINKIVKMKNFYLFLAFLLPISLLGQRNCGTMDHLAEQMEKNPELEIKMDAINQFTQNYIASNPLRERSIITIPVVVHVVWKTNSQNLSDAQIQSQIDVLNEDFRRTNDDANNQWSAGADTEIQFCLATVAPDGSSTTGIQRRKTNKPSFGTNDNMKFQNKGGINAWPADDYLNIWSCDITGGILGYAQFPGGADATDGVVIDYAYFGRGGSAQAPFDLGRTGTHEVGHWLNLRHIWGDGGCSVDDFVSDTPLSDAPNYGCATGHVSCSSVDMVENYMDYSDDACMNLYTSGQAMRMQALFSPGGARESLLNSGGCGNGGGGPTCTDGIQNGNETGIDCGGPDCDPCGGGPTCSDGVQNGNETGIDCGGPDCDPCNGASCDVPGNQNTTSIKRKRANISWGASSGATSYNVQVREQGGTWQTLSTSNTNMSISGTNNNVTYEWRVEANCNGSSSGYSGICSWTAGNGNSSSCNGSRSFDFNSVNINPNPANTFVNITFNIAETSRNVDLSIYTITGQRVHSMPLGVGAQDVQVDVSHFEAGIYIVRIEGASNLIETKKFIVAK